MRKSFSLLIVFGLIAISSCHKSSSQGKLTIKSNTIFGASALAINQNYQGPDGKNFVFQDFRFFLSHIKLVRTDNSTIEIEPVAFFSVPDSSNMSITVSVPNGNYKGIQFYIGLDSVQDAVSELTETGQIYAGNDDMAWGDSTKEYVFAFVDGHVTPTTKGSFEYHVGTAPYYTSAPTVLKNFSIDGGSQTLILNIMAENLFYNNSYAVNLATQNYTETGGSNDSVAFAFMADFSHIFSLQ